MTNKRKLMPSLLYSMVCLIGFCLGSWSCNSTESLPTEPQRQRGGQGGEIGMNMGGNDHGNLGGHMDMAGHMNTQVHNFDEPWIKMGTGFRRFESLEEGQRIPIIAGIQGGFHVWGAFQAGGFIGEDVTVLFKLYLDDRFLAEADYFEYFLPISSDGVFEYTGVSVIYFENDDVEPTSGQRMRLTLDVRTEEGIVLSDEIDITPICCE